VQIRKYSNGTTGLQAEVLALYRSTHPDDKYAAVRFTKRLLAMERDSQAYGSNVPYALMRNHPLRPGAVMLHHQVRNRSMYYSLVLSAPAPRELRALYAEGNGVAEPDRVQEAADRHNGM